jgi:hypothetical protein
VLKLPNFIHNIFKKLRFLIHFSLFSLLSGFQISI